MGEKSCGEATGRRTLLLASNAAYRPPVVPVVVTARVDIGTIKVQVVSVGTTANRTRPVVAVDAGIVQGTAIDIARPHNPEEDSRAALTDTPHRKYRYKWDFCAQNIKLCNICCITRDLAQE